MLAVTARQLGYGVIVLDPDAAAPAAGLADRVLHASYHDTAAAQKLAEACDVVTYEFENVPEATVRGIDGRVAVRPDAFLLGVTQDRVREHAFLHDAKRVAYTYATDDKALEAFMKLARLEGIIPALESSHAIAECIVQAPKLGRDKVIIVNLSGRGDKDVAQAADKIGLRMPK